MALLEVRNLSVEFKTKNGIVKAVRNLNYTLEPGEILGIVGESGSGKSVSMMAMLGLLASNGRITEGEILLDGQDISPMAESFRGSEREYGRAISRIRGDQVSMIFQDPMSYLNPLLRIGRQITEGIIKHKKCSRKEAKERAVDLMNRVGIPHAEQRYHQYPFEFSGGMRQRIIIAIALSCDPKLIIADEPTTALDVTVQAQILDLLREITEKNRTSIIMITHDMGVVAEICDRVHIMYAGEIVESGGTENIFYDPRHPYTAGLLESIAPREREGRRYLASIPGTPPDLLKLKGGCAFMPRCGKAMNICRDYAPESTLFPDARMARCWEYCRERADEIVAKQNEEVSR